MYIICTRASSSPSVCHSSLGPLSSGNTIKSQKSALWLFRNVLGNIHTEKRNIYMYTYIALSVILCSKLKQKSSISAGFRFELSKMLLENHSIWDRLYKIQDDKSTLIIISSKLTFEKIYRRGREALHAILNFQCM